MAIARLRALSKDEKAVRDMVTLFVLALLVPLLLVDLVFVAEMATGLPRGQRRKWQLPAGRTTIILPAHDEEQVIGRTLDALTRAAANDFEILVVADNCTDRTVAIAREFAVKTIERNDRERRGKGFALAFARDHLRPDPPAGIIVLDSDCRIDRDGLLALAGACQQMRGPVQAINLLEPAPHAGPLVQVSSFAFLVKNLVRQRGLQRLTGGVHLTGTGMCLPWEMFKGADLATASIVEDVRLGIELSQSGNHPTLIEEAQVWSPHADQSSTLAQRSRWEGGFLTFARATAPGVLAAGLRTGSFRTLLTGLDLLVPPLALLALLNVLALAGIVLLAAVGAASWLPVFALSLIGLVAATVLLLVWWREGRAFLTAAALVRLPLYPLWKLPMYLKLARSGAPKQWQRTQRSE